MTYKEYERCRRPYQEYGRLLLLERKHACLFYKPGKGKTYPTIDAVRDVNESKNGKAKVLILSTAAAVRNMWLTDIEPQSILPENTLIMSFTKAIQDKTKADLIKVKWDVIVIDECHHIKSHNAKISKLVHLLSKKTEYVFGLTGTPRGNSDIDIFCQFHNMCVSQWGDISYTMFVNQCCDIDQKFFHGAMIRVPIGINEKYRAGFMRNISMYSQSVDYDMYDNMPDMNVEVIKIPYTPSKQYLQLQDGIIKLSDFETTLNKLSAISKLQQAANGFIYITDDNEDERKTYYINDNEKNKWLENNKPQDYTTIIYKHTENCKQIKECLDKLNVSYTENVPLYKEGNHTVLLLQCSQSESFNLQLCNNMIFYTMDYSFINYDQMLHRIYRMGQMNKVNIKILLNSKSIEDKIWSTVKNKQTLSDLFYSAKHEE